jgi:glycosyltransferase involved in cell wall biosynthesis
MTDNIFIAMTKTLLQINSVINWGSTGRIAEEIGQIAIANGWDSYIAFGRHNKESKSQKIKIGNKWDLYWHIIMTRVFDRHGLASKRATKQLIKKIDALKPNVIHLHNIHGYFLNYKSLFAYLKTAKIPIVWTLHDCWSFTGHCSHFTYIKCLKWRSICDKCPQKKVYPKSLLQDRSKLNFFDKKTSFFYCKDIVTIISVSDWLANLCLQSFLKDFPIKRIYNGIDTNVFKSILTAEKNGIREKYGVNSNFVVLGVASTWSKRKGLEDFIKLRYLLNEQYVIFLIGVSKQQIKVLPSNIIAIERTENINELVSIYSMADVFVNPTWEDNFPTTNLEALSCGTPVITYKTGGSMEALSEETGFVVEQGNIEGLKKAIEVIKQTDKEKYSVTCRERVLNFFRKEDRYMEYIKLYEEINKRNNNQ